MNSDRSNKTATTVDIEILKRAIELDLRLSREEKAAIQAHLESGKYDMRIAVAEFSARLTVIMEGPSGYERGREIAKALAELEKACGL